MDEGQVKFSKNTRIIRKERGWTMAQLAEAADLSPEVIKNLEGGRRGGSVPTYMAIARAFKMSIEQILNYGEEVKSDDESLLEAMCEQFGLDTELIKKISALSPEQLVHVVAIVDALHASSPVRLNQTKAR